MRSVLAAWLVQAVAPPSPSPTPTEPSSLGNALGTFFDSPGGKAILAVAAIAGAIGALWAILFGGRGVPQILNERRERQKQRILAEAGLAKDPFIVAPLAHDNLPPLGQTFGRTATANDCAAKLSLRGSDTLHIKGPAGIGKSSFALQVAGLFLHNHPEYRAFHMSAKAKPITAESIADSIGRFFGVPAVESTQDLEGKTVILHRILNDQKLLLILDNVETVPEDVLRYAETLPRGVRTIRTSRTAPPPHDGSVLEELRPLTDEASRELMDAELARLNLGSIGGLPAQQVEALIELTGGNPLAVKWATGRLSSGISIHSVVDRLRRGEADLFESLFADNWTVMSASARRALMAASVQGFTVGGDLLYPQVEAQEAETETAISQLVDLGLFEPAPDPNAQGRVRYGLHPLARLFAQKKLAEDPARKDEILASVLLSLADFFEGRRLKQRGQGEYERLESELDGVDTALGLSSLERELTSIPPELVAAVQSVTNACSVMLWSRGYWEQRARQAELVFRLSDDPAAAFQRSRAASTAGIVRYWQGRLPEAEEWAGRADLPQGSSLEQGLGKRLRALVQHRQGQTGEAVAQMLTVLDAVRELNPKSLQARETGRLYADWVCPGPEGYRTGEVALTQEIGIMYTDRDQQAEAVYWLDKSGAIAAVIGDDEGASIALSHKGRAQARRAPSEARDAFTRGLELARSVGRLSTEGRCLLGLASLGSGEEARRDLQAAASIFTRLGMSSELELCALEDARLKPTAAPPTRGGLFKSRRNEKGSMQ